ncbi:MAG: biotin--[acetyl-CoA-carboxylase] ligase [Clostridia bacterium]|nr:biotin--[acetyl-CoA-carboxylase] ligase [Clostridia bacterium]
MARTNEFTAEAVNAALRQRECPFHVRIVDTVPSTNTALRAEAEQGASDGEVLVALSQTAGRGRLGRSFHSPDGTGLYFSLLLRPNFDLSMAGYLTPAAAVAVARALEASGSPEMKIKWVNDIYTGGKKVCGILTEAAVDNEAHRFRYAIIGIGINLSVPESGFPEDIHDVAGAAFEAEPDRTKLLADILVALHTLCQALPAHDFMGEYCSRSCLVGREATVTVGDESFSGIVQTIDEDGGLVLADGKGMTRTFRSGTIRVKGEPA